MHRDYPKHGKQFKNVKIAHIVPSVVIVSIEILNLKYDTFKKMFRPWKFRQPGSLTLCQGVDTTN